MFLRYGIRSLPRLAAQQNQIWPVVKQISRRGIHDGRNRLSNIWTPTGSRKVNQIGDEDGHDLLIRAGFVRQAHSGIFHLLPLGLRVQDKIERLIDKHMQGLGASKVSLSSLSSQDLWERSGRLEGRNSEFFKLRDRKDAKYLLSPTHEEEITTIVSNAVHSYKDLPLRLYQVSRKYRDEARPRQGLLRGREFVMKDLYTFDATEQEAMETYEDVQKAYRAFLDDIGLPYLVANADSGNMGGNHSHEYHFISPKGEDTIISCRNCGYSANEEIYRGAIPAKTVESDSGIRVLYGRVLPFPQGDKRQGSPQQSHVAIYLPKLASAINTHAIKELVPNLDTRVPLAEAAPMDSDGPIVICDPRISLGNIGHQNANISTSPFLLTQAQEGDHCPQCHASALRVDPAVEIGHTFHLDTRYSRPLGAKVLDANNKELPVSMGCHGVGVSRMIGAAASLLADERGLNWPVKIAPFGAVIMGAGSTSAEDVIAVYDRIVDHGSAVLDVVWDDRERPVGWRLNDADLVGYPFIIVLGKSWAQRRTVELQCRRLGLKVSVELDDLMPRIHDSIRLLE